MSRRTYLECHIPLQGFDPDVLSGLLYLYGCMGILEAGEEWVVYFPEAFTPEHIQVLLGVLRRVNPDFHPEQCQVQKQPYRDWNAEWRKYFRPFQPVEGIWIRPPWERLPAGASGVELIIDPQMGFGTGHHESTRLMIQALKKYPPRDLKVLDVGTGSGILAILARKLGARQVIAVDIDRDALKNARENLVLNGVDGVELRNGSLQVVPERQFDRILANIHREVLLELLPGFMQRLQPEGWLIISGILKQDRDLVLPAYQQAGLHLIEELSANEWLALIWARQQIQGVQN
ncbi:MAG: 50S ribosomal protein L11 methyltransferase [Calditrichaeota bacterium]|nr:50S ribosomal protein L11 methyltransferase [Calditrichota bacterium]